MARARLVSPENDLLNNVEADSSLQPIAVLLKDERDAQLYRAMKSIDPDYRQVLFLLYFENMKPEQISRIINKNIKQTYNLLARGKESLRHAFERIGHSWSS